MKDAAVAVVSNPGGANLTEWSPGDLVSAGAAAADRHVAAPLKAPRAEIVETDIPARLDRLPWGRFHTMVVIGLGVTWISTGWK